MSLRTFITVLILLRTCYAYDTVNTCWMDGERVSKFPLCRNQVAIINQLHREECRDDETCKRGKDIMVAKIMNS